MDEGDFARFGSLRANIGSVARYGDIFDWWQTRMDTQRNIEGNMPISMHSIAFADDMVMC